VQQRCEAVVARRDAVGRLERACEVKRTFEPDGECNVTYVATSNTRSDLGAAARLY
jgi:hypothetical protein